MKVRVVGSENIFSEFNSASYLIDEDILIDCPNGSWKQVRNLNKEPREISHICFTHFHGDHYFDVPFIG